ncbi:hypothetical protein HY413_02815 [Candidatus Kaiserbacteria bacterium]|nr:hypothetical protein [Candidatus Kaiserbacteria bacterium]
MQLRFLLTLFAVLALGIAMSVAYASDEECPEFEKHKCAKKLRFVPTKEPLVCVQVEVEGEKKVTYHFRRPDRTYYREPLARTFADTKSIWFAQGWFEQVLRDKGTFKICAGEKGEFGAVFEEEDIIRHLEHGPKCVETIRLTGGVYPKKQ